MKVVLVYPCFKFSRCAGVQEPLGILHLGAALKNAGHDVRIFDMTYEKTADALLAEVAESGCLGFYVSTPMLDRAKHLLDLCKTRAPQIVTVAGGPHPTYRPGDMFDMGFDFVVSGEGEVSTINLLEYLENRDVLLPAGVISPDRPENIPAPYIDDLNVLPFPARDLIRQDWYVKYNGYLSVIATRGCPYRCIYCKPMQDAMFGKKIRSRGPVSMIDEIREITGRYCCNRIYFKDDVLFAAGRKWFDEFFASRKSHGLDFSWMALARVDQVDEKLLALCKQGGLFALAFGAESGAQRVLDFYRKNTTVAQAENAFALCRKHGILTNAYFMIGAPDETCDEARQTVDLAKRLRPHTLRVFTTTPIPGHHLYEYATANGLIRDGLRHEYFSNSLNNAKRVSPMNLAHLSDDDIDRYTRKIYRTVMWENIKRSLTSRRHFRLAASNWKSVLHLVRNRL